MEKTAGIYIHIPFCVSKCYYCDFVSFAGMSERFESYKNALLNEIRCFEPMFHSVGSVYIGGGTPTVLAASYITEILETVAGRFPVAQDAEITVEANPGVFGAFAELRRAGVNRLSIGAQAGQDVLLKALGRVHTRSMIIECISTAAFAGFDNINADMMFALPGQTQADVSETVELLTSLGVTHISAYALTVEEKTPFGDKLSRGLLSLPDEETDRAMYAAITRRLTARGYARYEISNFAKPGFESRHNTLYWRRGEYAGFGLNAHSFAGNARFSNTSDLDLYIAKKGRAMSERIVLTKKDAMEEFMFLGLRLAEGVRADDFRARFGEDMFETFGKAIKKHVANGLLDTDGAYVALTEKGVDISNFVFVDFLL
jgi:oxygen-independent coproporphyrinogen-3 oxidase